MTKRKAANRLESKHIENELSSHGHNHVAHVETTIDFMYGPKDDGPSPGDGNHQIRSPVPPSKPNSNPLSAKHRHTVSSSPHQGSQVREDVV